MSALHGLMKAAGNQVPNEQIAEAAAEDLLVIEILHLHVRDQHCDEITIGEQVVVVASGSGKLCAEFVEGIKEWTDGH